LASFTEHGAPVETIVFHPDNTTVWSGGRDKRVRRWKTEDSGRQELWQGFHGDIMRLVLAEDQIFAGTRAGEVWGRGFRDGKPVTKYAETGSPITALAIDPESQTLAAGDHSGRVRIWDWSDDKVKRGFQAYPSSNTTATESASQESAE
jgi:WD40 repeat protein